MVFIRQVFVKPYLVIELSSGQESRLQSGVQSFLQGGGVSVPAKPRFARGMLPGKCLSTTGDRTSKTPLTRPWLSLNIICGVYKISLCNESGSVLWVDLIEWVQLFPRNTIDITCSECGHTTGICSEWQASKIFSRSTSRLLGGCPALWIGNFRRLVLLGEYIFHGPTCTEYKQ